MNRYLCPLFLFILKHTYPDQNKLIGEMVETKLEKEKQDFWIALKSINAEIDCDFGGGIMDNLISPAALCQKIKNLSRRYRLYKLRLSRVAYCLQVDPETVVDETRELIREVDQLQKIKDTVMPALHEAVSVLPEIKRLEKKEDERLVKKSYSSKESKN